MIKKFIYSLGIILLSCVMTSCSAMEQSSLEVFLDGDHRIQKEVDGSQIDGDHRAQIENGNITNNRIENDYSREVINYMGQKSEYTTKETGKALGIEITKETETLSTIYDKEILKLFSAGTKLDQARLDQYLLEQLFYYQEISEEVKDRMRGKSYKENPYISFADLRYVRVLHIGFDQEVYIGELVVNHAIAQDIVDIFKELFEAKYPIERMILVDEYNADDHATMEANNTSAFNYRNIEGTSRLSLHSYGLAIDINPLYNPYITEIDGVTVTLPRNGTEYADREKECLYYIREGDICYQAFIKRGFTWGGEWRSKKDYQHFQKTLKQ